MFMTMKKWIYATIIFCASFLLYARTIGFDFSYFDDIDIIHNNSVFFDENVDIKKIFTTDALLNKVGFLYRPLQNLSFAIDSQLAGGINVHIFHFTNVFIFALIGCFLFFLFRRFNISTKMSFIGTLLFVVHPMFTMSVSWIPARGDLLLTLFSILSMSFFIDFVRQQKYYQLAFSALFFLLALFSKETAAFLPFMFLLYFFCFQEKPKIEKKHVLFGVALLLAGLFWLYLRSISINADSSGVFYARYLLNIPVALSQLVVFPVDFSPLPFFSTVKILIGSLLLIFLLHIVFRKDEIPKKEKIFYISWFVLLLSPVFFSIQHFGYDYLEHRFLLPMIGVFLLLLSSFPKKWTDKQTAPFLTAITILSIVSLLKSNVYKNPETLYGAAIRYCTENSFAYNNRGSYRQMINNPKGALDDYNRAVFYNSEDAKAYTARGILKVKFGDLTGAMDDFNRAIYYDSENAVAYTARGSLKMQTGDLTGAMGDLNAAIKQNTYDYIKAEAYTNRAAVKGMMGNFHDALDDVNTALMIEPYNINAHYNRAVLYLELGNYEKALQDCEMLLKIDPDSELAIQLKNTLQIEQQ